MQMLPQFDLEQPPLFHAVDPIMYPSPAIPLEDTGASTILSMQHQMWTGGRNRENRGHPNILTSSASDGVPIKSETSLSRRSSSSSRSTTGSQPGTPVQSPTRPHFGRPVTTKTVPASMFEAQGRVSPGSPISPLKHNKRRRLSSIESSPSKSPGRSPATQQEMPQWQTNSFDLAHKLLDKSMIQLVNCDLDIIMDKGFRYSDFDSAFVGQKKNHFQVSFNVTMSKVPAFVVADCGILSIRELKFDLYGVKLEQPTERVQLDQSQVDRLRADFTGVPLTFSEDSLVVSQCVPRLHFCNPTANNMRRKGKANPDQRYFSLVAAVTAVTHSGSSYCVASKRTPGLIVRASNPRQFSTSEETSPRVASDQLWLTADNTSASPTSPVHRYGQVGINTAELHPDTDLTVQGNICVRGKLVCEQVMDGQPKLKNPELSLARLRQLNISVFGNGREGEPGTLGVSNLMHAMPEALVYSATKSHESTSRDAVPRTHGIDLSRMLFETIHATQAMASKLDTALKRIVDLEKELSLLRSKTGLQ